MLRTVEVSALHLGVPALGLLLDEATDLRGLGSFLHLHSQAQGTSLVAIRSRNSVREFGRDLTPSLKKYILARMYANHN